MKVRLAFPAWRARAWADQLMGVATVSAVVAGVGGVIAAATAARRLGADAAVAAMVAAAASAVVVLAVVAAAIVRGLDDWRGSQGVARMARILARLATPYLPDATGDGEEQSPWIEEWPGEIDRIPESWHRQWDMARVLCGFARVAIQARAAQILDRILASDVLSYTFLGAGVVGSMAAMSLLRRIAPAIVAAGPIFVIAVKLLSWLRDARGIEHGKKKDGDSVR